MTDDNRLVVLAGVTRQWKNCQACPLGATAFRHVLYDLPEDGSRVDVLFIGEAPGKSEDALGKPFIGRAGKFLRATVDEVNEEFGLVVGFSNLLACRPTGPDGKDRAPASEEVNACHGRLVSIIQTVDPWAIVGLGRIPEVYLPTILNETGWEGEKGYFPHPAYLIRSGGKESQKFPAYRAQFQELFQTVRGLKQQAAKLKFARV